MIYYCIWFILNIHILELIHIMAVLRTQKNKFKLISTIINQIIVYQSGMWALQVPVLPMNHTCHGRWWHSMSLVVVRDQEWQVDQGTASD